MWPHRSDNSDCICMSHHLIQNQFRLSSRISKNVTLIRLWLVRHSLGGSTASLIGSKYNPLTIVFKAPGERLAARQLGLTSETHVTTVTHITHVYNTLDRLALRTCVECAQSGYAVESFCHVGQTIVYDLKLPTWKPDFPLFGHLLEVVVEMLEDSITPVPQPRPHLGCMVNSEAVS